MFFLKNKFSFQYLENEPLNVLELIVDINWWIETTFLNIFWQKNALKNKNKFSFQYLENDPLNVLELIVDIIDG